MLKHLDVPLWSEAELKTIAIEGFAKLNVHASKQLLTLLAAESFGSPSLMQQICLQVCLDNEVLEREQESKTVNLKDKRKFFEEMAAEINPMQLRILMKGRSDRMDRTFADGKKGDIYVAVLKAIATLMPRTSIPNNEIKRVVNDLLVAEQPQGHEITRVLERMSDTARDESKGRPVIEWDRQVQALNIIDPTFGFYLKWGNWEKLKSI